MKKIKLLLLTFLGIILLPSLVNAASGSIKVTSANTVVIGNKVTVTVTLSSGVNIGSWEMNLNYDKSYLQLTNATSEAGGTIMANSSSGVKSKKYTYTFKTLKTGSTKVSIGSYLVYAYDDMSELSISAGSQTIRIITQEELEASYSKDNNLKSLTVEGYEITPEFNKNTLEYSVSVPEGTKEIKVTASPSDRKSSVSGDGVITVNEGTNTVSITVKAENGSEKVYTLLVNVIDENPINVIIDKKNYTVNKIRENYLCPLLYSETTIRINEFDIPACVNEKINYTLVGLKDEAGEVKSFRYNNGKYKSYKELVGTTIKLINEAYGKEVEGLIKSKIKIDGTEYDAYKFSDDSKYYVIYGINVENGDKGLYVYDSINKTFSGYDTEYITYLKEQNKIYLYVIIAFGCSLLLSLICIISLSKGKKKIKKKLEKKEDIKEEPIISKQEDKVDKNAIKEIDKEDKTDTYYLFDNDKKSKKKVKK